MIDLNQIVGHFLDEALWQCTNEGGQEDNAVINSLNNRNQNGDARQIGVLKWLRYYGVLQGLTDAERKAVANEIVGFADSRAPDTIAGRLSEADIIDRFSNLHDRCRSRVRSKKDQTQRNLTSLTSKALWCCYPDYIPLFDSYAQRALWILSRFMGQARPAGTEEYRRFVKVWFSLYRDCEHMIDAARLADYRYKVRVFDRILWIIGQPDYGEARRQPMRTMTGPETA